MRDVVYYFIIIFWQMCGIEQEQARNCDLCVGSYSSYLFNRQQKETFLYVSTIAYSVI